MVCSEPRASFSRIPQAPRKLTLLGFQVLLFSFCFVFANVVFSFNRHLLLPTHVPGTVLGIRGTESVIKTPSRGEDRQENSNSPV